MAHLRPATSLLGITEFLAGVCQYGTCRLKQRYVGRVFSRWSPGYLIAAPRWATLVVPPAECNCNQSTTPLPSGGHVDNLVEPTRAILFYRNVIMYTVRNVTNMYLFQRKLVPSYLN